MEVGVPLTAAVASDGETVSGTLPAGRYAVVQHVGDPEELLGVTSALLEWAERQGMAWDVSASPDGELAESRLEIYHPDPGQRFRLPD